MTGPEHYKEAERLAREALTYEGLPGNSHVQIGQVAQVHALLALADTAVTRGHLIAAVQHPAVAGVLKMLDSQGGSPADLADALLLALRETP